jgi:hypothetical protein
MTTVRTIANLTAKQQIDLLAAQHGIVYQKTQLDDLADTL